MNILYITPGIRKGSFEFAVLKQLKKNGHEITIVSTSMDTYTGVKTNEQATDLQPITIDEFSAYILHYNLPMSLGGYCKNASKLAKSIIEKFDIVHISSWYYHPAIVFAKISDEKKIPFIISAYATLQKENRDRKKIFKRIYDNIYTKKLIPKASAMHSVGNLETKAYVELGVKSENIFEIAPAISRENFVKKNETKIFSKLGLEKENMSYLLFLGRIVKRKRIELILNAFSKVYQKNKRIFLVIAGSGTESYENELKQLTKSLGIEKNVKFAGLVMGDEKLDLLESAKILVHTASGDIHPLAVEEALTMKVPVVVTDCDMPEIEKYEAGIIVESKIDSLSDAILELIENKEKYNKMSNNAEQLVDVEYLVEKQVKKYIQMYETIIQNN